MRTVSSFFEMVYLNEYHNIRIKSRETDTILAYFDDYAGMVESGYEDSEILSFATDWDNKIYILWV